MRAEKLVREYFEFFQVFFFFLLRVTAREISSESSGGSSLGIERETRAIHSAVMMSNNKSCYIFVFFFF